MIVTFRKSLGGVIAIDVQEISEHEPAQGVNQVRVYLKNGREYVLAVAFEKMDELRGAMSVGDALARKRDPADAALIAAAWDMQAALLNVRKLIAEAAMTGFNCHDGDWAGRLFASQQITSAAIAKSTGQITMTPEGSGRSDKDVKAS